MISKSAAGPTVSFDSLVVAKEDIAEKKHDRQSNRAIATLAYHAHRLRFCRNFSRPHMHPGVKRETDSREQLQLTRSSKQGPTPSLPSIMMFFA
jgi:hypothetical protein